MKVWLLNEWLFPSTIIRITAAIIIKLYVYLYQACYCVVVYSLQLIPFMSGKCSSSCSSKINCNSVRTLYAIKSFHLLLLSTGLSPQRYSVTNSDRAWLSQLPNRAWFSPTKLLRAWATSLSFDIVRVTYCILCDG